MPEITYLMDDDPAGFFDAANDFFTSRPGSEVVTATGPRSLEEVFTDLQTRASGGTTYATVNLVSQPSALGSLRFPVSVARGDDDDGRITLDTLKHALLSPGANGYPAPPGAPAVTAATSVVLYGSEVGRDAVFMALLGQLFGPELSIYAPMRAGSFVRSGATVEHRLLRTWSTPWPDDISTTTQWAPVRTDLADALVTDFASPDDPGVETAIRAAAQEATAAPADAYVLSESVSTVEDPASGDLPRVAAVLDDSTRDDTAVELALAASDLRPAGAGVWRAWIARLAQVLDEPVSIDNGAQYRRTVVRAARTASATPLTPEREPAPVPDNGPDPDPDPDEDDMTFFGKYRGTVTDSDDPTSSGRLKVDVPTVSLSDVWAEASIPPVPTGLLRMPQAGDTVWVEFEAGDETKPIWTGATWDAGGPAGDLALETAGSITLKASRLELRSDAAVEVHGSMVDCQTDLLANHVTARAMVTSPAYTPGAGNLY